MKRKGLILAILLLFIVILSSSAAFAEDASDLDNSILQEDNDIQSVSQSDEDTASQSDEGTPIIEESQDSEIINAPKEETITVGSDNAAIQKKIDNLSDGDVLNFETGEYNDICLIVNKSITINGNGATLRGYDTPSKANTPLIIYDTTENGGYGISNFATLFIVKTNHVTINGLTFIGGANSGTNTANALIYAKNTPGLIINNNVFDGSCTGIYLAGCANGTISNNQIKNQASTGILNFQSARTLIENNTVINAKNHGIDARHDVGPEVKVINNTVIGSKEGIYFMHSHGHIATNNTLINCTISSISCYGAWEVKIYNNKFKQSRIGILLGGIYSNIEIGENEYGLYDLPFPPIFKYYVAEAKQDYQDDERIMGTHTDLVKSEITYSEFTEIPAPGPIVANYDKILNKTGTVKEITAGMTNDEIQAVLNSMADGDTLSFEANAKFYNISLYTDKNIKIIGNNATLYGNENANLANMPVKIRNTTENNGYGITYRAVLYSIKNENVVISDLNIVSRYPDHKVVKPPANQNYQTCGIFASQSQNITITNCHIDGASFGIFLYVFGSQTTSKLGCNNALISNNYISNQFTYGIINFASKNSKIVNNTVVNARYHGIDVRFESGSGVTVFNNTVIGSQEGIYLMHSGGHYVYGNTVKNSKVSSISAYGSHDEYIFNNTLEGSRIGILIGGEHYNVTIGKNSYKLDAQKSGDKPGFGIYLVESKRIYDEEEVAHVYNDQKTVTPEITSQIGYDKTMTITLTDADGQKVANRTGYVKIADATYNFKTDSNGIASVKLDLAFGNYENVTVKTISNTFYTSSYLLTDITVADDRAATKLTAASSKSVYLQAIAKGTSLQITLKDANGKVISGKTISVKFNGKTVTGKTNSKGVATVKLTTTKTGSQKATITFKEDASYKGSTATTTFKVTKEASKISAAKKTFRVKKSKKYTVSLKSKSGKAISKVKVTLKVKGKKYTATTNSKGKATFNLKKLTKKGKYTAKINFAGNKYFNKSSKSVKITVKK